MQNNLETKLIKGKQSNQLAEEGHSTSGHIDAAGLLINHSSPNPYRVPSLTAAESPQEPTCSPKKNLYSVQQGKHAKDATASRSVHTDAHAAKSRDLSKGHREKKARRWQRGEERTASQGRKLLDEFKRNAGTNTHDPLEAFFHFLGLPCHPGRVGRKQNPLHPSPATCGGNSGEGNSDFDTEGPLSSLKDDGVPLHQAVDRKYTATASTITRDQLEKYLRWQLVSARRDAPVNITTPSNPVSEKDKKPINPYHEHKRRTWSIHDITAPVQRRSTGEPGKFYLLERKITQFLSEERVRIETGVIKLPYPDTWLDELKKPEPPKYHVPLDYANFVAPEGDHLFKREAKFRVADAQSSSSSGTDSTIVPRKAGFALQPGDTDKGETPEMIKLLSEVPFREDDTEATKRENANKLNEAVQRLNIPWKRHTYVVALDSTIGRMLRNPLDVITYFSKEDMESNDLHHADGNTMLHWDTTDHLQFEPYIIEKFIAFPGCPHTLPSEGRVEKIVGNLLSDVVTGAGMIERDNAPLPFPEHLKAVGTNPSPDIYVRATTSSLDWVWNTLPVLFAGECKPIIRYDIWKPRAQLAMAFHGTLISLILYYLDTREDVHSPLPPWLFLYGVEYMEHGVVIHAHYPAYSFDESPPGLPTGSTSTHEQPGAPLGRSAAPGGRWTLQASLVSDHFHRVFNQNVDASERVRLLAIFFRIRSHTSYVLKQLEQWKRGKEVLSVLVTESNPAEPESAASKRQQELTKAWVVKGRITSSSGSDS